MNPLTEKQHVVLSYIEQRYLERGGVPTKAMAAKDGICTENFYANCLNHKDFRAAMAIRGLPLGDQQNSNGVLTPEQLNTANIMLDLRDNRSQKNKLKDCGVPTQKWEAWLRDPAFQHYLRTRAESTLGDNLHESHLALVDRVRSGDINAIKYFNEITGRYAPARAGQVDVNAVLMRVLEIIQKHVRDPLTMQAIADDMLMLANGQSGMANGQGLGAATVNPGGQIESGFKAPEVIEGQSIASL